MLILFVCPGTSASTESEAPSGALKIETLAAALGGVMFLALARQMGQCIE